MALTVLRTSTVSAPGSTAPGAPAPPGGGTPLRVAVEVHQRAAGAGALCVMTLAGDLDRDAGPHLRSALEGALLRTWSPRAPQDDAAVGASATAVAPDVVVDVAALDAVDAAGVELLLANLRRTTALGGRAAVVGAGAVLEASLLAADAAREVSLHATLTGAVSAWGARARSAAWAPVRTGPAALRGSA